MANQEWTIKEALEARNEIHRIEERLYKREITNARELAVALIHFALELLEVV